jgi:hypothetical protein
MSVPNGLRRAIVAPVALLTLKIVPPAAGT